MTQTENNLDNNVYGQLFIQEFENICEEGTAITDEQKETLAAIFPTAEDFRSSLPLLQAANAQYASAIEETDKNKKAWDASKKLWKGRLDNLMLILGDIANRFKCGPKIQQEDVTLAISNRTVLNVDTEWLLKQYEQSAEMLRAMLPEFIKVEISVDKNKLAAFVKADATMLKDYPEKIHFDNSQSITFKTKSATGSKAQAS